MKPARVLPLALTACALWLAGVAEAQNASVRAAKEDPALKLLSAKHRKQLEQWKCLKAADPTSCAREKARSLCMGRDFRNLPDVASATPKKVAAAKKAIERCKALRTSNIAQSIQAHADAFNALAQAWLEYNRAQGIFQTQGR